MRQPGFFFEFEKNIFCEGGCCDNWNLILPSFLDAFILKLTRMTYKSQLLLWNIFWFGRNGFCHSLFWTLKSKIAQQKPVYLSNQNLRWPKTTSSNFIPHNLLIRIFLFHPLVSAYTCVLFQFYNIFSHMAFNAYFWFQMEYIYKYFSDFALYEYYFGTYLYLTKATLT